MDQELREHLEAMEARLTEKMRDMQTELLRGFAAFSEVQTIRLRGRGGSIEPGRRLVWPRECTRKTPARD
jgi:hypothetical protein